MKPTTSKRNELGRARLARYGLLVALSALGGQAFAQTTGTSAPAADTPNSDEDIVVLSEFNVSTEKDYGYRAANSIAGTRTNTPIKDVPMNIQVFTKDLYEDLNIKNQVDLEAYNAALVNGDADRFSDNVIQQAYQQFLFRGFRQNWGLRDGVREYDPIDTHGLARVEVVKGPAAALYGLAYPGGVMQNISKQVEFGRPFASFRLTAGQYGDYRATADINVASEINGQSFGIRYAGVYEQTEDERAHSRGEINFHQVNLAWKPAPSTLAEFLVEEASRYVPNGLQGRFEQAETGISGNFASIPIQEIKGIPYTWNWSDGKAVRGLETRLVRGSITHKFGEQFSVRGYLQYSDRMELPGNGWDANGSGGADSWENGGGWDRQRDVIRSTYMVRDWGNNMHAYGATAVYKLDFEGMKNTFAFGANAWYEDEESRAWGPINQATTTYVEVPAQKGVKIITPKRPPTDIIPYSDGGPNGNAFHHEDNSNDYYFVNWQASFLDDRVKTNVGVNKTNLKLVTWNSGASIAPENTYEASKVSPMVGSVFAINKELSVFGLYSTSLFPDSTKDSFGNQFGPQIGKSLEAGFKMELMEGKINGTISFYQITQTGGTQSDPNADNVTTTRWDSLTPAQRALDPQFTDGSTADPNDYLPRSRFVGDIIAGGEQQSKGIDIDMIFQPSRNWQLMTSISSVNHEFTESAVPETIGQTYPQAIKTRYAFLTKYTFSEGGAKGLALGLGLHGGSKALKDYVNFGGETVARYEPARRTVDFFAIYQFKMFERKSLLQLNIRNLLGEDDYVGWKATGSSSVLATKRYAVPLKPVVRLTFGLDF